MDIDNFITCQKIFTVLDKINADNFINDHDVNKFICIREKILILNKQFTNDFIKQLDKPRSNDNPVRDFIRKGDFSHYSVAKLLIELCKPMYKCASIKHNIWYEYQNGRWVEIDSTYSFKNLISNTLVNYFVQLQKSIYILAKDKKGDVSIQFIEDAISVTQMIKRLNNPTFKNAVIQQCAFICYDESFLKN